MNETGRRHPGIVVVLMFVTILLTYSYNFHNKAYDNALSRLDLAFSMALRGTLDIDAYHANTIDKSFYRGHFYCDKAPGLSAAAVPAIFFLSRIFPGHDWSPDNPVSRHIITFLIIGLPSAAAFLILFSLSSSISGSNSPLPAFIYSIGTLALPYSAMFYSHQFCAVLLATAFHILYKNLSKPSNPTFTNGFTISFLSAFAFTTEYPAAVPAALLVLVSFFINRVPRHRAGLAIGLIIPVVLLGVYNNAAFGGPFNIGYGYEVNQWFREEMSRGIGGVSIPNPKVFFNLLLAPQRGLFWGQPFLMLAIPGLWIVWRKNRRARISAAVSAVVILSALLINSGYYEPYGGFSPGPRFLVWSLPFWIVPAAAGFAACGPIPRGLAIGAGFFSSFYYLIVTSVEPHVPHIFQSPLFEFAIPLLKSGWKFTNSGTSAGLDGLWSLVPLAVPLFICFSFIFSAEKRMSGIVESTGGFAAGLLSVTVAFLVSASAMKTDPAYSSYYLGTALTGNGGYASAESYLAYSTSVNPGFAQAHYALGIAQIRSRQYNDAIESFKAYVGLEPEDRLGYVSLTAALAAAGRYPEAWDWSQYSLSIFPGDDTLSGLKAIIDKRRGMENGDER